MNIKMKPVCALMSIIGVVGAVFAFFLGNTIVGSILAGGAAVYAANGIEKDEGLRTYTPMGLEAK